MLLKLKIFLNVFMKFKTNVSDINIDFSYTTLSCIYALGMFLSMK